MHSCKGAHADMGEARDAKLRVVDKRNREIRPRREATRRSQDWPSWRRRGPSEAESQIVVAAGLEQGEGAFQVIPRLAILAGEPAGDPGGAMGDAGFGQLGFRRDVVEEGRSVRPHRRQLAPHVAADP